MKTSEIFAACIPLIEGRDIGFICHALYDVICGEADRQTWSVFRESSHFAKDVVMERLGGYETLFPFAYDFHGVLREVFNSPADQERWDVPLTELKEIRIAWLKSLVAEFQQLGD